jgi:hypothetical protein
VLKELMKCLTLIRVLLTELNDEVTYAQIELDEPLITLLLIHNDLSLGLAKAPHLRALLDELDARNPL